MSIEERPLRHHDQKRKSRAAEPDVQCLVDVLCDEAGEEGDDAGDGEEDGADCFGETLAFEVLCGSMLVELEGFGLAMEMDGWDVRFHLRKLSGLGLGVRPFL